MSHTGEKVINNFRLLHIYDKRFSCCPQVTLIII